MNYKEAVEAHGYYQCGASLSKVGRKYNIPRNLVHYYFKMFRLPTRPLVRKKTTEYNGDLYTANKQGYLRKTTGDREFLHRQKWKDKHGAIPPKMHVHYKDEDRTNNEYDNFELIDIAEHTKLHGFKNNQHTIKDPEKYRLLREAKRLKQ